MEERGRVGSMMVASWNLSETGEITREIGRPNHEVSEKRKQRILEEVADQ